MTTTSISLKNVSFGYPGHAIFKNINLDLTSNKKIALHAPNGAGKTTLLHLLANMLLPDQGSITHLHNQAPLSKSSFLSMAGLGFSNHFILQDFTLLENIQMFSNIRPSTSPHNHQELIEKFSLQHLKQRTCRFLSQGERKKLQLVLAFMHQPSFILLDEPTNGLDARAMDMLADLIKSSTALTIIASHQRGWSSDVTHKTLTIEKGDVHVI